MHLGSEHFIVDQVKHSDKDNLKLLEDSRPWAKIIKEAQNVISDKDKSDYFEELGSIIKVRNIFGAFIEEMGNFAELYS